MTRRITSRIAVAKLHLRFGILAAQTFIQPVKRIRLHFFRPSSIGLKIRQVQSRDPALRQKGQPTFHRPSLPSSPASQIFGVTWAVSGQQIVTKKANLHRAIMAKREIRDHQDSHQQPEKDQQQDRPADQYGQNKNYERNPPPRRITQKRAPNRGGDWAIRPYRCRALLPLLNTIPVLLLSRGRNVTFQKGSNCRVDQLVIDITPLLGSNHVFSGQVKLMRSFHLTVPKRVQLLSHLRLYSDAIHCSGKIAIYVVFTYLYRLYKGKKGAVWAEL